MKQFEMIDVVELEVIDGNGIGGALGGAVIGACTEVTAHVAGSIIEDKDVTFGSVMGSLAKGAASGAWTGSKLPF